MQKKNPTRRLDSLNCFVEFSRRFVSWTFLGNVRLNRSLDFAVCARYAKEGNFEARFSAWRTGSVCEPVCDRIFYALLRESRE